MTIAVTDAATAVWDLLKNQTGGAGTRAKIMSGTVLQAGFLTTTLLTTLEDTRRTAGTSTKILALTVQDVGDRAVPVGNLESTVIVLTWDRGYGYLNLGAARDQILEDLRDFETILAVSPSRKRGVLTLDYLGRTGQRWSQPFGAWWEALRYQAQIIVQE